MERQADPVATAAAAVERAIVAGDHEHALERAVALVSRIDDAGTTPAFESELDTLLDALHTDAPLGDAATADAKEVLHAIEHQSTRGRREAVGSTDETLEPPGEAGSWNELREFEARIEDTLDE